MRIGLVADIHDAVEPLRAALAALRQGGADRIVTLGDAFETCRPGDPGVEVARLLREAGAVGVWGNHDAGLSLEVTDDVRALAAPDLLDFSMGLLPQLTVDDCRFSHVEPWRDPCRVEEIWGFDAVPDTEDLADRCFDAVPERVLFVGHFHHWLVMKQREGRLEWDGSLPIRLAPPGRHLVLVGAVLRGWCAVYDTGSAELTPIRCGT